MDEALCLWVNPRSCPEMRFSSGSSRKTLVSSQLRRFLLDRDLGADLGPAGRTGSDSGLKNVWRSPRRSWNMCLKIKEKPGLITQK